MTRPNWLNELGARLNGIRIYVNTITSCSYRCPSCGIANSKPHPGKMMDLPMFNRVLDWVQEGYPIRDCSLYLQSEPTLHPQIHLFVRELTDRRVVSRVSTVLTRPERIESLMAEGLTHLIISMAGFEHDDYYHRGRDVREFRLACDHVSTLMAKYPMTNVLLCNHRYRSNVHELEEVQEFAASHGFTLSDARATFSPYEKILSNTLSKEDLEFMEHMQFRPGKERVTDGFCFDQSKIVPIEVDGTIKPCAHLWEDYSIIGDIYSDTVREIRRKILKAPVCRQCKSRGLHACIRYEINS